MTGRSPARLLAPLALVVCAVALFVVVTGGGDSGEEEATGGHPAATATATPKPKAKGEKKTTKTYTVRPGDTPSAIAERLDVPVSELLDANPDVDPNSLTVGEKLKLP